MTDDSRSTSNSPELPPEIRGGLKQLQTFLCLGGGSLLYCLSAVFVTFGIVKLLGPLLIESESFSAALPCLATLAIYELALLGALLLVVSRGVIDDAVSIVVLIALFQVGSSMVLGTVADKSVTAGGAVALAAVVFAAAKLAVMRRRTGIRFGAFGTLGILLLAAANYLGPVVLAESLAAAPTDEAGRRELWQWSVFVMLLGGAFVVIEATRRAPCWRTGSGDGRPFLHTPAVLALFALLMTLVSGAHQYLMAFTFAMEHSLGDIVPLVALAAILLLELLRHCSKYNPIAVFGCSLAPLLLLFSAIWQRSVFVYPDFGIGLLWYPPVLLGLIGVAIAALARRRRDSVLRIVAFVYLLGVMLTFGYSPDYPRMLNTLAFGMTLVAAVIAIGILKRNQRVCAAGWAAAALCCHMWPAFGDAASAAGFRSGEAALGLFGAGLIGFWMLYGRPFNWRLQLIGAGSFAWFLFRAQPTELHWWHAATICLAATLIAVLWIRSRSWFVAILGLPCLVAVNLITRVLGPWRYVMVGFFLLAAATVVSLRKKPRQ